MYSIASSLNFAWSATAGHATLLTETGVSEISVFDGKGNEKVVRTEGDSSGQRAQATGDSSAEAAADARKLLEEGGQSVGEGLQPVGTEKSDVNP